MAFEAPTTGADFPAAAPEEQEEATAAPSAQLPQLTTPGTLGRFAYGGRGNLDFWELSPEATAGLSPWPPSAPPFRSDELELNAAEALDAFRSDSWLFPPGFADSAAAEALEQPEEQPQRSQPPPPQLPAPAAPAPLVPPVPEQERLPTPDYVFRKLRSPVAQEVVASLLVRPQQEQETAARAFQRMLRHFCEDAHGQLSAMAHGGPLIPEEDRQRLTSEANDVMQFLVQTGQLNVKKDLVLCLEAFGASLRRRIEQQDWMSRCLAELIDSALKVSSEEDQEEWRKQAVARISDGGSELYANVDVRSWPAILKLARAETSDLDKDPFVQQVELQLCCSGDPITRNKYLQQAAELISELSCADFFTEEAILSIFNDRAHFDRHTRLKFLKTLLRGAPRGLVQRVLHIIDETTDVTEHNDEELQLVKDLVIELDQDVRCCPYAYYSLRKNWLVGGRREGVVVTGELTAEQICDHIEDDPNLEELLKTAVNSLLRDNRKHQAARMLARPAFKGTKVYETNKNDKQLAYLVSLYQELTPPEDSFRPIEEDCLTLPFVRSDILFVENRKGIRSLEERFLEDQRPQIVGVCWLWRSIEIVHRLDRILDRKARASFLVLCTTEGQPILVDLQVIEYGQESDRGVLDYSRAVLSRILSAPHIVKVVHDLDNVTLKPLQYALVQEEAYMKSEEPPLAQLSPVLDVAVVAAYVRHTEPGARKVTRLHSLTYDYLRLELCLSEALSNFERRPLRDTQLHYALTLAWCPLMILRPLCTYGILPVEDLQPLCLQIGAETMSSNWGEEIRRISFWSPEEGEVSPGSPQGRDDFAENIQGEYGMDLWSREEWVNDLQRPNPRSRNRLSQLRALALPEEAQRFLPDCLQLLVDHQLAQDELAKMYEASRVAAMREA